MGSGRRSASCFAGCSKDLTTHTHGVLRQGDSDHTTLLTGYCLKARATSGFKSMARSQGCSRGILDPGYTKMLLCGQKRAQALTHLFCGPVVHLPGRFVRFGAGGAVVEWCVPIRVTLSRGVTQVMTLDVVSQTLPLLVGIEAAEKAGLVMFFGKRELRTDDGTLIGKWEAGELMTVDVEAGVSTGTCGSADGIATLTAVAESGSDGAAGETAGTLPGAEEHAAAAREAQTSGFAEAQREREDSRLPATALAKVMEALSSMASEIRELRTETRGARAPRSPGSSSGEESPRAQQAPPEVRPPPQRDSGNKAMTEELRAKLNKQRSKNGEVPLPEGTAGRGPSGHGVTGGKGLGKGKRRVSCQGPSGHEGVVTGKDGQDDTEREGNVRKGKDGKHHVKVRPKVSSTIKEQVKTSKVPKILGLDQRTLQNCHEHNHAGASRMKSWVTSATTAEQRAQFKDEHSTVNLLIDKVVKGCYGCEQHKKRLFVPKLGIPDTNLDFNEQVFIDVLTLDKAQQQYALAVIDCATGESCLHFLEGGCGAPSVMHGLIVRWVSVRGWPELTISDVGGELKAQFTTLLFSTAGAEKRVTAGKASEQHGRVERLLQVYRYSIDRFNVTRRSAKTALEWQMVCALVENGARNEILNKGFSASQRATGRMSGMTKSLLHETMGASSYADPNQLIELMEQAIDSYNWVRSNRALGSMMSARMRPKISNEILPVGAKVDYFTTVAGVRGRGGGQRQPQWTGAGRVVGWMGTMRANSDVPTALGSGHYVIEANGQTIYRTKYHVRPSTMASNFDPKKEPEFAERMQDIGRRIVEEQHGAVDDLSQLWDMTERALALAGSIPAKGTTYDDDEPPGDVRTGVTTGRRTGVVEHDDPVIRPTVGGSGPSAIEKEVYNDSGLDWCKVPTGGNLGRGRAVSVDTGARRGTRKTGVAKKDDIRIATPQRRRRAEDNDPIGRIVEMRGLLFDNGCKACLQRLRNQAMTRKHNCKLHSRHCAGQTQRHSETGVDECFGCIDEQYDEFNYEVHAEMTRRAKYYQTSCLVADYEEEHANSSAENIGRLLGVSSDYGLTWDGLSVEQQNAAYMKGVNEYHKHQCWHDDAARSKHDLRRDGIQVLSAAWRGQKAKFAPDGTVVGRIRWTPRGFEQRDLAPGQAMSPTVARASVLVVETLGMRHRMLSFQVDWESAFFQQGVIPDDHAELWCQIPDGDPRYVAGAHLCGRLRKWVPGTKMAPVGWYNELVKRLLSHGFVKSRYDPCVLYKFDDGSDSNVPVVVMPVHVDDARGRVHPDWAEWIETLLTGEFSIGEFTWCDHGFDAMFTGTRYQETAEGLTYHQKEYVAEKLDSIDLKDQMKYRLLEANDEQMSLFRTALGKCAWTTHNWRYEYLAETCRLQGCVSELKVQDLFAVNRLIRLLKQTGESCFIPRLSESGKVFVQVIVDGGGGDQATSDWKKGQSGILIGIGVEGSEALAVVQVRSARARRVTHDSFDVETVTAVDGVDAGLCIAGLVEEFYSRPLPDLKTRIMQRLQTCDTEMWQRLHVPVVVDTDCLSLVANVKAPKVVRRLSKRRAIDVSDLRECVRFGELQVRAIEGITNPLDAATKAMGKTIQTRKILVEVLSTGVYRAVLQNVREE